MRYFALILILASGCLAAPIGVGFNSECIGGTNLVAWWQLNENTGTTFFDASGNAYTGYLTNTPTWSNGVAASALNFASSSSQWAQTTLSNLMFTNGTVTWWQNPTSAYNSGTLRGILGQEISSPTTVCGAKVHSDNNWYVGWYFNSTDRRVSLAASTSNWKVNEWHHYAFVWTTTNVIFYMDGGPLGTNSTGAVNATNINTAFLIGRANANAPTYYFPGRMDDVRVYKTNLSLNDLTNLYNGGYATQR